MVRGGSRVEEKKKKLGQREGRGKIPRRKTSSGWDHGRMHGTGLAHCGEESRTEQAEGRYLGSACPPCLPHWKIGYPPACRVGWARREGYQNKIHRVRAETKGDTHQQRKGPRPGLGARGRRSRCWRPFASWLRGSSSPLRMPQLPPPTPDRCWVASPKHPPARSCPQMQAIPATATAPAPASSRAGLVASPSLVRFLRGPAK